MSKTHNAKVSNPFDAMRATLLEVVDTMTEGQGKATEMAQAELAKAKGLAADQIEKTQASVQANIDATVTASETVAAGVEKVGALVRDELAALSETRVSALKRVLSAKSVEDVIDINQALVKSEQATAQAFFQSVASLGRNITEDAMKPVKAQAKKNIKAFSEKVG